MLAAARARRFDVLIVESVNHICQSTRELVVLLSELLEIGIYFTSASEKLFDTFSNMTLVDLVGAFEYHERKAHGALRGAGLKRRQRQGLYIGRKRAEIDVERARRMQRDGKTLREIADELGCKRATLQRRLVSKVSTAKPTKPRTVAALDRAQAAPADQVH